MKFDVTRHQTTKFHSGSGLIPSAIGMLELESNLGLTELKKVISEISSQWDKEFLNSELIMGRATASTSDKLD